MELSRREKEILAQIEGEFTPKEAGMAAALNAESVRRQSSPAARTWLRLLGLLALGLAMIPIGIRLFGLGPIGVGVLTLCVIAPWTLLAAARLAHSTTGEQPPTTTPPAA
ncbi:DUF3040 domain-containing protein [Prauserella endophytica]|uniref:DUF3040 domain-containing protein n=1 Tax=Prauserella endophytica TaxID=1592324 RepID=A0ABY2RSP2_9PSEU|nr:DUF3040 domain-containing protein [Prauserella endophytica]TKG57619.1 DUF3040 domain-containing protein [Prauserella endophytica]